MISAVRLLSRPTPRNKANSGSTRTTGGSIWLASTPRRKGAPPVLQRAKA